MSEVRPPVPRHLRNPRRGYTEDGHEIPPCTIASDRDEDAHTVAIRCDDCRHGVILSTEGLPGSWAVPDVAVLLNMRCHCGSRRVVSMKDMTGHYAGLLRKGYGGGVPPPDDYVVVPWQSVVGAARREAVEREAQVSGSSVPSGRS